MSWSFFGSNLYGSTTGISKNTFEICTANIHQWLAVVFEIISLSIPLWSQIVGFRIRLGVLITSYEGVAGNEGERPIQLVLHPRPYYRMEWSASHRWTDAEKMHFHTWFCSWTVKRWHMGQYLYYLIQIKPVKRRRSVMQLYCNELY